MTTFAENMQGLVSDITSCRENRQAWLDALRASVRSFRHETAAAIRKEMRTAARDRRAWVGSLRAEIGQMREELSSDLESSRRAWLGVPGRKAGPGAARSGRRTRRSR